MSRGISHTCEQFDQVAHLFMKMCLDVGIGFGIVKALAKKGCTVLLGARTSTLGQEAASKLQEVGRVQFLELDVMSDASVDKAAAAVRQQFGHLDILVRIRPNQTRHKLCCKTAAGHAMRQPQALNQQHYCIARRQHASQQGQR